MKIDWGREEGAVRPQFLHLNFLVLIGLYDCVTLVKGVLAVYPRVCRDESMAVFILIAPSQPHVINTIISVSAGTVITNVFIFMFVIVITATVVGKIIFCNAFSTMIICSITSPYPANIINFINDNEMCHSVSMFDEIKTNYNVQYNGSVIVR